MDVGYKGGVWNAAIPHTRVSPAWLWILNSFRIARTYICLKKGTFQLNFRTWLCSRSNLTSTQELSPPHSCPRQKVPRSPVTLPNSPSRRVGVKAREPPRLPWLPSPLQRGDEAECWDDNTSPLVCWSPQPCPPPLTAEQLQHSCWQHSTPSQETSPPAAPKCSGRDGHFQRWARKSSRFLHFCVSSWARRPASAVRNARFRTSRSGSHPDDVHGWHFSGE